MSPKVGAQSWNNQRLQGSKTGNCPHGSVQWSPTPAESTAKPPPDHYFELRLSFNTFCMLIWMLFGDECDCYKGLLEVAGTLNQQEVHIIHKSFTADVCRCITRAILTDGRSFFTTVLGESQFRWGEQFRWPMSLIHKITDNVRFAKAINRPM